MSFEPFNTPFEKEAYLMLYGAENVSGRLFVESGDLALLANDIKGIADDSHDDVSDDEDMAFAAAKILLTRVGGMRNVDSYMKCLRVGVSE